ncbi:MAG TPA: hypothetical protein P5080_00350 [Candidatus Paceibacterota bacterium]|nr:hypothetical protein [Candidatus Pacearchaeota archaeon]HRZ50425.1 hypothetical protein [Candidatus Paceibacterota bacterium]HSA36146.1 hypothetical protein [Candidatus Paceibacterota bacterium]
MDLWYATLPAPFARQIKAVAEEPVIGGLRYNIGCHTPWSPQETVKRVLAAAGSKELWLDLKGGQLRVERWSLPPAGQIILNHKIIKLGLPAKILFRHEDEWLDIAAYDGNEIFVDPVPGKVIGQGQAANIRTEELILDSYLTKADTEFIEAGNAMGIHRFMLSYVEKESDIASVFDLDPKAIIAAKIETPKGLDFVREIYPSYNREVRLLAACDDLYINIGQEDEMLDALYRIVDADPKAIAASRLFMSLQYQDRPALSDLSHYRLLQAMGYKSFMLSDSLCARGPAFLRVAEWLKKSDKGERKQCWWNDVRDHIKRFGFR